MSVMLRNNAVLIPPEDLGSGSQFSVMKSLLSETVLQGEFSSLILGANNGIQINLDIQYYIYIWLPRNRIQCPSSSGPTKAVSRPPAGAQCVPAHTVSPSCWAWTPRLEDGITEAPDNCRWCDCHS